MKNFLKEFKAFIQKGNVLDLAVGMIIGTAFNTIVKSLVNDIIMPLISVFFKVNVVELNVVLVEAVLDVQGEIIKNAVTLNYGTFLQSVLDFLIIALSVFVAIKVIVKINNKIERLKTIMNKEDEKVEETLEVEEVLETTPVVEESDDKKILNVLVEIKNLLNDQEKKEEE